MPAERVTSRSPWHIIFVIDDSGSMSGPGATAVNESMDYMIEELKLLSQGQKPYFKISVIKFGSNSEILAEAVSEQDLSKVDVTSFSGMSGSTNLAAGLREAKAILLRNPGDAAHFDPFLFILSDGVPDSENAAKTVADEIKNMEIPAGRPCLVTIGVGSVSDSFMSSIATQHELYKKFNEPRELSRMFPAIGTVAQSATGAKGAASAIMNL